MAKCNQLTQLLFKGLTTTAPVFRPQRFMLLRDNNNCMFSAGSAGASGPGRPVARQPRGRQSNHNRRTAPS